MHKLSLAFAMRKWLEELNNKGGKERVIDSTISKV